MYASCRFDSAEEGPEEPQSTAASSSTQSQVADQNPYGYGGFYDLAELQSEFGAYVEHTIESNPIRLVLFAI
jgi:hypothetical protein